jgi:hypothetical protein
VPTEGRWWPASRSHPRAGRGSPHQIREGHTEGVRDAKQVVELGIRDAIAKTKDFPSVSGTITLDADRNPIKPAVILKIRGGRREFFATVTP